MYDECIIFENEPRWFYETCPFTPLALSWSEAMPLLSAPTADDAEFAMAGGDCKGADWLTAATRWLAIDLDDNGRIDDASELFGADTALKNGEQARDGYEAIASLDSNEDGQVSETDDDYPRIVAWSDYDGDRESSPRELQSLAELGIESISLDHGDERVCDHRGNCAVGSAAFTVGEGVPLKAGRVVDLYLACRG